MKFKGCGKRVFCEHNKDNLKCGKEWNGQFHYCDKCLEMLRIIYLIEDEIKNHKVKIKSMGFGEARRFVVEWNSALEDLKDKLLRDEK